MPVFAWTGTTASGETRSGEMKATSPQEVRDRLQRQDISPGKVRKKRDPSAFKFGGGVPLKTLVVFTRQFATMIDAGLPLVQCLELLGGAEPHAGFKKILTQVRADIESGSTLADAMAKHPGAFDNLYVNLIAAGEAAGILDTIMNRLATQIEKTAQLRRKIRSAFSYPTIVMVIAVLVVFVLLYKVIPTFESMFAEMGGGELPAPTQVVIDISEFTQDNFFILVGGMIAFVMLTTWTMNYKPTRAVIDRFILKVPLFGPLVRKTAVARFTRTLGTMVSSGVPIVDALEIVANTAGNMTVQKAILYTRERISEGQNMVDPLMETGVFPPMVVQMIGVGESTGALDVMLTKIADFYEEEVDVAVDNLTSMLEPLMMVFLGIIVGGMLIAMYLPIFTMAGNIKG
ncbi:type II secretion system F family protein [Bradymonas sediminis]|uniref:Type II secretion system F family protein n=1 Tax=Bradymonas sediminis TaxID=1548548 RepID=A0A2Z4FNW5_9DELT|nr:type II secretion system F family protein [Bradymonas sediminis]AWV90572.1 type II secretion system F family protein [Bradymonas sediminis]TDP72031.1 type IV pilus assembly protein PilC [Bradymonas sediminis]